MLIDKRQHLQILPAQLPGKDWLHPAGLHPFVRDEGAADRQSHAGQLVLLDPAPGASSRRSAEQPELLPSRRSCACRWSPRSGCSAPWRSARRAVEAQELDRRRNGHHRAEAGLDRRPILPGGSTSWPSAAGSPCAGGRLLLRSTGWRIMNRSRHNPPESPLPPRPFHEQQAIIRGSCLAVAERCLEEVYRFSPRSGFTTATRS